MSGKKLLQINVSLKEHEYEKFNQAYYGTNYRSKAAYARKLLLGKPATVLYRNRSLDDFIETAVQLRKDLKLLLSKETFTAQEKTELNRKLLSIEENLIKTIELCKPK
jgi:hypothetical protein